MTNRRKFLTNTIGLGLGLPFISKALAKNSEEKNPLTVFTNNSEYWNLVRQQFPLDKNRIYLNNGTMGPSPLQVIQEVYNEMLSVDTYGKYGGFETEALQALSGFLGCDKEELALTHNVTEGNAIVAMGLRLKKGDEVIMTTHEHVGNALPWLNRAKRDGIVIKTIPYDKKAANTFDNIFRAITPKTRVIAVPHMPCTIGQILDIKKLCKLATLRNIITVIDGAHPPGMLSVNLHELGCDYYTSCCHKWMLGPKGTGFLYVKKDNISQLDPMYVGAGADTGWDMTVSPPTMSGWVDSAHKYFYGSQSASLYKGIIKSVDFLEQIGIENIEARVRFLSAQTREMVLNNFNDAEILSPDEMEHSSAVTTFRIPEKDSEKLASKLRENGIVVRHVHEGKLNALRISTHIYNNILEVEKMIHIIKN